MSRFMNINDWIRTMFQYFLCKYSTIIIIVRFLIALMPRGCLGLKLVQLRYLHEGNRKYIYKMY